MARRKKKSGDDFTENLWINTYSTCITVILAFFIFLFCITEKEQKKVDFVAAKSKGTYSHNNSISAAQNNMNSNNNSKDGIDNKVDTLEPQDMFKIVEDYVNSNSMKNDVEVKNDSRGVIIQVKDSVLFESAKADLIPSSKDLLDRIAKFISQVKNNIEIEGHTDNVPINTFKFESNWELSTNRAVNVLRYFVEYKKLDPKRFGAEGYGEYRPLVSNDTPENRAQNRRINIIILTSNKGE
ncbi:OmpA family protein [Inconstantimicrobium mannanitabidum]|uniref:Chemotaxis protein MotB n=1 Tax=Inconstantimicrobium mannanitabidum TaxID=1604901 RepID=A0ACB5R8J5_9CLOT|nr:OmpA family protein [Clostridium sp. TW13]GKX65497.1 chemotaxis protein MotB [Clostridium sp. TW13]